MTIFDEEEYKKQLSEEKIHKQLGTSQDYKDAIHHQNVIDYIMDSLPDILAESIGNLSPDDNYWPEDVATLAIRHLTNKDSYIVKDQVIRDIGTAVLAGIINYAERMVSMNEN